MARTVQGTIRGRTIELAEDLGLNDGQEVRVQVTPVTPPPAARGDGIQRSAGTLAGEWTEEDDRILEEIYQDRKRDTGRDISE